MTENAYKEEAYLYGVLLGDGFYGKAGWSNKANGRKYAYVMLKAIDWDFVNNFREKVKKITGKSYSIYKSNPKKKNRNILYICKCYSPKIVEESARLTKNKTEIPNFIMDSEPEIQKQFLQGLMDSEGYVTMSLSSLKQWHVGIYFANTSAFTKDVWHMFHNVGISTSKLSIRKMKDDRKDVFWFKIDILDYVEAGMTFNIKRKRDRLEFISIILRDYMCSYKKAYKMPVEEIVRPVAKASGV